MEAGLKYLGLHQMQPSQKSPAFSFIPLTSQSVKEQPKEKVASYLIPSRKTWSILYTEYEKKNSTWLSKEMFCSEGKSATSVSPKQQDKYLLKQPEHFLLVGLMADLVCSSHKSELPRPRPGTWVRSLLLDIEDFGQQRFVWLGLLLNLSRAG